MLFSGLTESIIAAAGGRIGKTVLHLDQNDYYGGFWASFNLQSLCSLAEKVIFSEDSSVLCPDGLKQTICHIENVDLKWLVPEKAEEGDPDDMHTVESLLKKSRLFNIDISPTLLYSTGAMVKLLISSNICRYAEFRAVDRIATLLDGITKTVPCSRSDVFVTNEVNVVEKRIMMKLIETCVEYKDDNEEYESFKGKTFREFLTTKRAPAKVQHYLLNALSMCGDQTPFEDGVRNLKKFVESLGRYGNSPFLFPMYGCGEIPQCYCRLCAVFGGIYCLQRGLKSIEKVDSGLKVKLNSDDEVSVGNIIFGPGTIKSSAIEEPKEFLARGILIVDQPLKDTNEQPKGGGVEFLRLTHENSEAYLIHLSHYSGCCPKDLYLYHFISPCSVQTKPREALTPFIDQIFPKLEEEEKPPKILFELFFSIPVIKNQYQVNEGNESQFLSLANYSSDFQITEGIHMAGGPTFALDYDNSIEEARKMFQQLYPDGEFLPRAPEPEEIIMDGYDGQPQDGAEEPEAGNLDMGEEKKSEVEQVPENYPDKQTS